MPSRVIRTPRFHCTTTLREGETIDLPEEAARHALTVLRLREGDELLLFNGDGGEYRARAGKASRRSLAVAILERRAPQRESPLAIELVQGVSSSDRMDFAIQKAVELGVVAIHPVATEHSVTRLTPARAASRAEHWRRIVIAACGQSGRNRIPTISPVEDATRYCARTKTALAAGSRRLLLSPRTSTRLRDISVPGSSYVVAAGPEAGFSEPEERDFLDAGFVPVTLGPRILRTETAALAAIAALNALVGDG